jgi:hypothetical protein
LDFDDFEITREDIKSWLFSGISLGMKIKYWYCIYLYIYVIILHIYS